MYINVVGPPGSGKSYFIKNILKIDNRYAEIDRITFDAHDYFMEHGFFEHTGHNRDINEFLVESGEQCITYYLEPNYLRNVIRIILDSKRKPTRNWKSRLRVLKYCFKHRKDIFLPGIVVRVTKSNMNKLFP